MKKLSKLFLALTVCGLSAPLQAAVNFAPYHEMTLNMSGGQPMDLTAISQKTGIRNYNLAFVVDGSRCRPAWDGDYTTASAWGKTMTDKMRAAGIAFNVSFGGAGGTDISRYCTLSQLQAAYQQIINTYQPTGLDFDIENGTANVANVIAAIKAIKASNPNIKISFTLPVMPSGLESEGKSILTQAKNAGFDYVVNIMAMDYGSSYTGNMGTYATQAATSTFNYLKTLYPSKTTAQLWAMVAVTPMIGVNDVTQERFTLANADTLTSFAAQNGLAWLAMWSLDRDKPCGGSTPVENCSSGNVQTKDYEFTAHFLSGTTPPPATSCLAPQNIAWTVSSDKRAVTFTWQAPAGSTPITAYQVNDYQNRPMWKGLNLTFTDASLPGTAGSFGYYFLSNCQDGTVSPRVQKTVTIR